MRESEGSRNSLLKNNNYFRYGIWGIQIKRFSKWHQSMIDTRTHTYNTLTHTHMYGNRAGHTDKQQQQQIQSKTVEYFFPG